MAIPATPKKPSRKVTGVPADILALLQAHPEGLDIYQIRTLLALDETETQQHLDRRLRQLDPLYLISRKRSGRTTVYRLESERQDGAYDYAVIPKNLRAQALRNGRCAMCGRTVEDDGVKLHADHRIPREWGGLTVAENLVGLCSACNEGKKNYFAGFDPTEMKECIAFRTPHMRLAMLLKAKIHEWVDTDYLEFVSNFRDYQEDWQRRLRELRDLGLEIDNRKVLTPERTLSQYRLNRWVDLPPEDQILAAIRAKERGRKAARDRS